MSDSRTTKIGTPANVVTIVRILGVPFLVVVMLAPWEHLFSDTAAALAIKPWIAALVFLALSFSDFLDGYLARSRNEVTNFGKFMDPLADKLLVIAAFLAMTEMGLLPAWVSLIVLFREFLISGLRMLAASKNLIIAASWCGKAKTVTQMIAITLFILIDALPDLVGQSFSQPIFYLAWCVLIVSLLLTVFSLVDYFVKSWEVFQEGDVGARELSLEDTSLDIPLPSSDDLYALAEKTLAHARAKGLSLGTAESLTGGLIAATLTEIPGSSDTFWGGVTSYAYSAKTGILGVDAQRLSEEGAVHAWTAQQMSQGARKALSCSLAVAVTGIAGPGGAEEAHPVGTVWISVAGPFGSDERRFEFTGARHEVRLKTVAAALLILLQAIESC